MRVLFAIFIGWLVFKYQMWESLVEIGFYVFIGWLILKAYDTVKESLRS